MTVEVTRGMILGAGLGTRLRPLTDSIPKPLIQVGDRAIIDYSLELLSRSWIADVVINLHHLGKMIKKYVGSGAGYNLRVQYSEEPEILGTAGGIKMVEEFFGNEPFVVINGDIITDVNLTALTAHHIKSGSEITLVLRPIEKGENYTPVLEEDGRVVEFGSGDLMYAGVQIINPSALRFIKKGEFSNLVQDVYIPVIKSGSRISSYIHDGFWIEVGTPDLLMKAQQIFEKGTTDLWYLE